MHQNIKCQADYLMDTNQLDSENLDSKQVKESLQKRDIHEGWEKAYRTPENEKFYNLAFDYIAQYLDAPKDSTILDAGCGNCSHSIHLEKRGYKVQGIDYSEAILESARENINGRGLGDRIKVQREDILSLSFGNETFNYIFCWGVLMHIPDVEKAIAELARVLKQGGILIIEEGNMYSLQSLALRIFRFLTGRKREEFKKRLSGIERWKATPAGPLFVRQANIGWLCRRFEKEGLVLRKRLAGQFTELYSKISSTLLQSLIHYFNNFWFKYIRLSYPAFGNILIFQKMK